MKSIKKIERSRDKKIRKNNEGEELEIMIISHTFEEFCFKEEKRNETVAVGGNDLKRGVDGRN